MRDLLIYKGNLQLYESTPHRNYECTPHIFIGGRRHSGCGAMSLGPPTCYEAQGLGPTPSLASSHPWVYSAHPQMSFISAHVLECSTANCNMHARFCFLLHRDLTFPSNSQAFTASSVRPSSSHFQNWRIFGFTRDRWHQLINPALRLCSSQADVFRRLLGSLRPNLFTRTVLSFVVMFMPSKMTSSLPA